MDPNVVSSPARRDRSKLARFSIAAGYALAAAVLPAAAALLLWLSSRARRAVATRFLAAVAGTPDLQRRITLYWAAGFAVLAVGQAIGAAAGPLSIFSPQGLLGHTLFALIGEAAMATATARVMRRFAPPVTSADASSSSTTSTPAADTWSVR